MYIVIFCIFASFWLRVESSNWSWVGVTFVFGVKPGVSRTILKTKILYPTADAMYSYFDGINKSWQCLFQIYEKYFILCCTFPITENRLSQWYFTWYIYIQNKLSATLYWHTYKCCLTARLYSSMYLYFWSPSWYVNVFLYKCIEIIEYHQKLLSWPRAVMQFFCIAYCKWHH